MSQVKTLPNIVEPRTIYTWRSGVGNGSDVGGNFGGSCFLFSPLLLRALFYQCDFIIFDYNLEILLSRNQRLERKTLEKVRVIFPSLDAKSTTQLPGLSWDLREGRGGGGSHPEVPMGNLLSSQKAQVDLTVFYKTLNAHDLGWMVKSPSHLHFTKLPMVRGKVVPSLSGLYSSSHTLAGKVEEG